jgi:predicted ArsR family transcriptional regulator
MVILPGPGRCRALRRGLVEAQPEIRDNVVVKTLVEADRRTRDRVARLLLQCGPTTAGSLGERLQLTPAAVRRHLDALMAEGLVAETAPRPVRGRVRGRGRPARLFVLTESGHAAFPHSYDDLASSALRFLAASGGQAALSAFAERRVDELERRYRPLVATVPAADRVGALAEALTGDGYAASSEAAGSGVQLCQHHCPVQHVAEQFPQLCEAETAAIGRLLGSHVQRLATIAHGDGVCTTHIPSGRTSG